MNPDIEAQRAFYDKRWTDAQYANRWQLQRAIAVLEGLRMINKPSPRILDLACGTGWLASMLGRFGPTMGVDLSPVAIHRAQVLYPDIRFVAGDLFDLELPSQSFDVVVSVQVIDHMDNQARFIELVARLLAPGGHLILVTTNARNVSYWTPQHFERFASGLQPIERWLTPRELKSLLLPYFRPRRIWTILPIFGDRGVFRFLGSVKLARALGALGVLGVYESALLRAGFGLVMVSVAERLGGKRAMSTIPDAVGPIELAEIRKGHERIAKTIVRPP
jgi:2-polyprenyl-3-methyl-5-hydroxy-6-metoxy-1,4-benzoquinol methylase